jgi:hypothetical protein
MEDITEKFNHLFNVVSSQQFLKKEALGGEIPFFISAYNAVQELEMNDSIKRLISKTGHRWRSRFGN